MEVINYIFYRLYKHYNKEYPKFTAAIYISAIEIAMIFFIFMLYNAIFYHKRLLAKEIFLKYNISQGDGKLYAILFCIVLQLANYLYYKNRVKGYETKFANHPMNKWFKLWMLYFIGLFLFFFPILIFMLRK
jgi:hypothetical protein